MRAHKENEGQKPGAPLPPRRHSKRISRQELGLSSRATGRRDLRRRAQLWLPCLAVNARILVLVNGVRVSDNVFDYVGVGGDFVVDMDLVDRVEVVVGPSASLYGNNAFFAVVNIVTRRGHDLSGGEVTANAGSQLTWRSLSLQAVRSDGNRWALYAQDQLKLPGPLTLTAGLRYDR